MRTYRTTTKVTVYGPNGAQSAKIIRAVSATCKLHAIRQAREIVNNVMKSMLFGWNHSDTKVEII